nr:MAG TPA: hypothetical protein [Caudoviricetes sp.]
MKNNKREICSCLATRHISQTTNTIESECTFII